MGELVYWHLPGFSVFRDLNTTLIDLMKEYPNSFYEDYRVGSVYGTFPGAIWNGGRTALGFCPKGEIERTIKLYNGKHVPMRFTWTNPLIEECHVQDTYCNLIMHLADTGDNQVLVNSPVLEKYLRENYPDFKMISSTTKRITDPAVLEEEMKKDYFMVVLDYDLNRNEEVLKSLEPMASRVEILVDEICFPGCPKRVEHYLDEGKRQLEYDVAAPFPCPNKQERKSFEDCKKRPAFISKEELQEYRARGFQNFKLVGRGLPQSLVMDSYLYYLVKEEEQEFIKNQIAKRLTALAEERARRRAQAMGGRK
jgi:collagenase-like PrtC family protease